MGECVKKFEGIFIRTAEYLNDKDVALVPMFMRYTHNEIPIYYQYCQEKKAPDGLPEINKVGYATNFRLNNISNSIEADVFINLCNPHAYNWDNEIDNYVVRVINNKNKELEFDLVRLVIYNKDFKRKRMEEVKAESVRLEEEAKRIMNEEGKICQK